VCVWITFFASLFYYSAYFWYYSWAPLHFFVLFMGPAVRGVHGSGLCPTRNRPAHIRWKVEQPTANRRQPRVESDRSPVDNGRVSRSQSEFQPLDLRRIFARSVDFSLNLCYNHRIEAKTTTSSPDLSENFHLIAGS